MRLGRGRRFCDWPGGFPPHYLTCSAQRRDWLWQSGRNGARGARNHLPGTRVDTQHSFGKRVAVFFDWDSDEDVPTEYIQTLKAGLETELSRQQKWGLASFFRLPLTSGPRTAEYKNSVGTDLIYNF